MTGRHEARREHVLRDAVEQLLHPLDPAEHTHEDGPQLGWNAADVDPAEYSSDSYAAQFPEVE